MKTTTNRFIINQSPNRTEPKQTELVSSQHTKKKSQAHRFERK